MSSFLELVKTRYSVRAFSDRIVEPEKLACILEAARYAPSACNFQPWLFIVIDDERTRLSFLEVYGKEWFIKAPLIIAVCCNRTVSWKRTDGKEFGDIDTAIALDHLTLAAAEQGLGSCWIGAFDERKARQLLQLPEYIDPVAFTPIGYPESIRPQKKRKPLNEIVYRNIFKTLPDYFS